MYDILVSCNLNHIALKEGFESTKDIFLKYFIEGLFISLFLTFETKKEEEQITNTNMKSLIHRYIQDGFFSSRYVNVDTRNKLFDTLKNKNLNYLYYNFYKDNINIYGIYTLDVFFERITFLEENKIDSNSFFVRKQLY